MKGKIKVANDILLVVAFAVTAVTGVQLHVGEHVWNVHLWASAAMLVLGVIHLWLHLKWYRKLLEKLKLKRIEVVLTDAAFLLEIVTGAALYAFYLGRVEHSELWGDVHFIGGLVLIALGLVHTLRRLRKLPKLWK